ncbi:MAG: type II secretion system protein [Verrucomicrobiota bacterium]|jgi:type II secretory pathway pseudopilin PulG
MKIETPFNRNQGFSLIELIVIIAVAGFLAASLLSVLHAAKYKHYGRINCVNNLHEIGTAFQVWAKDHYDKYPMQFAFTNDETLKFVANSNAYILWLTLSNELNTPKALYCLDDKRRKTALSFSKGFNDANVSYFFNVDATAAFPQMILDGDDNLAINDVRVKPGILNLPTTNSLAWSNERHYRVGNLGMADGSVWQTTSTSLNAAVINATNNAPVTTCRWVIP